MEQKIKKIYRIHLLLIYVDSRDIITVDKMMTKNPSKFRSDHLKPQKINLLTFFSYRS